MYCTNCGNEVSEKAFACIKCGLPTRAEKNFCYNCGEGIISAQVICVKCGVGLSGDSASGGKNKTTAGIFALLLGGLGIHKFYHGSWGWGILYILFIWTFIPAILGVIEGIVYLLMDNAAYDSKYNSGNDSAFKW